MAYMNITAKNSNFIERINQWLSPDIFALIDQARSMRLENMSCNTWSQKKLAHEIKIGSARA
jgi:hypothetical protein